MNGYFQDYNDRIRHLSRLCADSPSAADAEKMLSSLASAKRTMLEASAFSLQEADALSAAIRTLRDAPGMADAFAVAGEPNLRQAASLALGQVELWLEDLHEKRVRATREHDRCVHNLRLRLQSSSLAAEINALAEETRQKVERLAAESSDLGSSASDCDSLMRTALNAQNEAEDLKKRCERLLETHSNSSTEISARAFTILDQVKEYQRLVEVRIGHLMLAQQFFRSCHGAQLDLDTLERQIAGKQYSPRVLADKAEAVVAVPREDMKKLTALVSNPSSLSGVMSSMQHLETKLIQLQQKLRASEAEGQRYVETLENFEKKIEVIETWTREEVRTHLREHARVGPNASDWKSFLEWHKELINKIHMKTFELEGLRGALTAVASPKEDDGKKVTKEMDLCNENLTSVVTTIGQRLAMGEKMLNFMNRCNQMEMELADGEAQGQVGDNFREKMQLLRTLWSDLQRSGREAKTAVEATNDQYMDKREILTTINDNLSRFQSR